MRRGRSEGTNGGINGPERRNMIRRAQRRERKEIEAQAGEIRTYRPDELPTDSKLLEAPTDYKQTEQHRWRK